MYTLRNSRWNVIYHFAFWPVIAFAWWNTIVVGLFTSMMKDGVDISLPIAPLGTIGVAVAFYIGFQKQSVLRSHLGSKNDLGRDREL